MLATTQGYNNVAAYTLSRNCFLQEVPEADGVSVTIPQAFVDKLVREQPYWTSSCWAELFSPSRRLV